jgi:hypothetical protein
MNIILIIAGIIIMTILLYVLLNTESYTKPTNKSLHMYMCNNGFKIDFKPSDLTGMDEKTYSNKYQVDNVRHKRMCDTVDYSHSDVLELNERIDNFTNTYDNQSLSINSTKTIAEAYDEMVKPKIELEKKEILNMDQYIVPAYLGYTLRKENWNIYKDENINNGGVSDYGLMAYDPSEGLQRVMG